MQEHNESKLCLPNDCLVPLDACMDNSIPAGAKIYLGELNALASKDGCIFASDKDLAEMKGVSVKSIERWHALLESGGYIYRQTWREHYKDHGEKGVKIKTKRRIYIRAPNESEIRCSRNNKFIEMLRSHQADQGEHID